MLVSISRARRASSSTEQQTYPLTPSLTTSFTDPPGSASTGVPHAIASIMTNPKGSSHWIGNNKAREFPRDRKSTRLNSSHGYISYAVFCLKKNKESGREHGPTHQTRKHHRLLLAHERRAC